MNGEIILSLCIPTYNRGPYLDKCLKTIVREVGNNNSVEIVISDNVSDDNTPEVVHSYMATYSNIRYLRNDINIGGDKNFIQVLTSARGEYLKLLNDYVEFKEGAVLKILEIVSQHLKNREVLFFANGASYLKRKDFHYSKNLSQFIAVASYWSTWIGAFGIWREDLHSILKTYTFKTANFRHTEMLFASFENSKTGVTYSRPIYSSTEILNKKAPYNFFDFFVNSYFNTVIKGLKNEKKISYRTYLKEKNRFFTDFIFFWYKKIRIKKDATIEIDDTGMEAIVFNTYKFSPVFYLYLLYLPFYLIGFYVKKFIRYIK